MSRKEESQEDRDERKWSEGHRAAWRRLLGMALNSLAADTSGRSPEAKIAALTMELEDVRACLRELCEAHGDNDWPDDLHLGDVIRKHLAPYLDDATPFEGDDR